MVALGGLKSLAVAPGGAGDLAAEPAGLEQPTGEPRRLAAAQIRAAIAVQIREAQGAIVAGLRPTVGVRQARALHHDVEAVAGKEPATNARVATAAQIRRAVAVQVGEQQRAEAIAATPLCIRQGRPDDAGAECGTVEQVADELLVFDLVTQYPLNNVTNLYLKIDNLLDDQDIVARSPGGARPNKPRTAIIGVKFSF